MKNALRDLAAGVAWQDAGDWGLALAVALVCGAALLLLRRVLSRRMRSRAASGATATAFLADAAEETHGVTVTLASAMAGAQTLALPPPWPDALRLALGVVVLLQVGLWGNVGVRYAVSRFVDRRHGEPEDPGRQTGEALIRLLGNVVVWSAVTLMLLANLGVDVTALVAGLGVGGIAVALALQNVLSDVFASVSILLDKPFRRGDFIIVDETLGVVEKIGLKTTRVRSLWGEQVVLSNASLLASRIRNYKRMQERRVVFQVGVVYATPAGKLPLVADILRESIQAQSGARFDRAHLASFADFSLVYEAVYYVLSSDYNVYMDLHQEILLAVYRRFEEEGIEFAFPTRTLFVRRESPEQAA